MDIDTETYVDLLNYDLKNNLPKKIVSFNEPVPQPIVETYSVSKPIEMSDDAYLSSLLINNTAKNVEITGVSKISSSSSYMNVFGISLPMAFLIFLIFAILLIVIVWLCSGSSEQKKPKKDIEKK